MASLFDLWKTLAGIAIFLLGMKFIEDSLKQLSGRRFKLFLKKQSSNKLKAISGGAIVTAVLQSSSLVNLLVVAFVGAGVVTVQSALAVILGANLGTTFTSWMVAMVGFNMNIENIALPVAGIAGLAFVALNKQTKWYNWSQFFLGFSFLFIGLGYMKAGIEGVVVNVDLQQFQKTPLFVFLGIGFLITALIQSSSATVAITLSALHAEAITFPDATAIVLGSEVGTTIKLFIAAIGGVTAKRQVAMGNFIINVINVALILLFLIPINMLITDVIGIKNNLIGLVFFQSLINVIGILLFYPFLSPLTRFLEKRFKGNSNETLFIYNVSATEVSSALLAMEKESRHFFHTVLDFTWAVFEIENRYARTMLLHKGIPGKSLHEKYEYIKFLHGEIHSFYIQVQKNSTAIEDIDQLDRLVSSFRNAMYSAKSIKDAIPDIEQLRNSSNDIKYEFYKQTHQSVDVFCEQVFDLLSKDPDHSFNDLIALYRSVTEKYTHTLTQLYKESTAGSVNETEITTLLNFNREIFTFFKSMVFAAKDYLFDREQSKYFEDLPGFIR